MRSILLALAALAGLVLPVVAGPGPGVPTHPGDDGVLGRGEGIPEEELDEVFSSARGDLLAGLEKHAEWCNASRLYLERNNVYERIVALDPDHHQARTGLGYRRRDGAWELDAKKARPPKNYKPAKLKEAGQKLAEALQPYTGHLHAFLDARGEDLDRAQLHRVLDGILAMNPDDERAHALLGHARIEVKNPETGAEEPAWVLVETATAKERRAVLGKLVRDQFKQAPTPREASASNTDERIDLPWKCLLATDRFRVVGTVSAKEAAQTLRAVHVAEGYFRGTFGTKTKLDDGMTVYLLADPEQRIALIDGHPNLLPSEREFLKTLDGSGLGSSQDIGHWAKSGQRRADGVVRIALGSLFTREFNLTTAHAWIYEGFGLYMTYEIVRSRLNWFAVPSRYIMEDEEKALRSRMIKPETGWMQEAWLLLQQEDHPAVLDVLGKGMDEISTHDLLLCYALAAFLLEAHPAETPGILKKIGAGEDAGLVLADALGLDFDALEDRIVGWLAERR